MTMLAQIHDPSWLVWLSQAVRLSILMAFPYHALEPKLYRKVGLADME